MAVVAGNLFGLVLGTALLGALVAWILRKILPIALLLSYTVGVFAMTIVYALAGQAPPEPFGTMPAALAFYALGGALGFGILALTARRRTNVAGPTGGEGA